jgi:cell division protein FtsA
MKRAKGTPETIIVGVDIGTTKICVLVAQHLGKGNLEIIGIGKSPSHGLARGVVVDIAPAVQSIKSALREAELMSGVIIESGYIGISGSHIQARNSQGVVAVKNSEIRLSDIDHVITAAKAVPLPEGQHILHVLPQFFIIDGNHRVRDPRGLHGVRLEAQVHIISGALASVQNLVRCCEMAGLKARDIILEPLASAEAVLSDDEKELGAFMLDIGGGTSDLAFYHQGTVRHTKVVPLAGDIFTHDIALCLRTTLKDAERVKKEHGCSYLKLVSSQEKVDIEVVCGTDKRSVARSDLSMVIEARAQELFEIIREEINTHQLQAPAGLILTGGGSLLAGIQQTAHDVLGIPVRIGKPRIAFDFKEALDSPMYATSYGLLLYALKHHHISALENLEGPFVNRVFSRMKSWVSDFF